MSIQLSYATTIVLVVCLMTSPAAGNWFGKRGDKADLFSVLLQQHRTSAPKRSDLMMSGLTGSLDKMDDATALRVISNVIEAWKQQFDKSIQH